MKEILKKIFPRTFLKRLFLIYNKLKSNSWDKLFFRKDDVIKGRFAVNEQKNPFLELKVDTSLFTIDIQRKFFLWTDPDWSQDQYLLHYNQQGYIEPSTGWCVTLQRKLVYASLGFSSAPHVRKPGLIETYFRKKKVTRLANIISLRDTGEENYFHFFNDVLAKIFFLQDHGVNIAEYKCVISAKLYSKHYFQFFIRNSVLGNLDFYVQEPDEWIQFDQAIFCKPYTHTKKYFDRAIGLFDIPPTANEEKRIFLTRSVGSLRFIENLDELQPILKKYNFEILETSGLDLEEQVSIFNQCRYVVAIHGAGVTNVIFRQEKPLSLLEIVPPMPYIPFHYIMICKLYGYQYDVMMGFKGRALGEGGFRVDLADFEAKLAVMITTE